MLLLATQVSGTFDAVQVGIWMVGGLLALIAILIGFIWQDNKKQSESKHNDLVGLINRLDARQGAIEKRQSTQAFQIVALNTAISIMQGKPFDFDLPTDSDKD